MQLETILGRVRKHPSFVYETVRPAESPRLAIEVEVRRDADHGPRRRRARRRRIHPPRRAGWTATPAVAHEGRLSHKNNNPPE